MTVRYPSNSYPFLALARRWDADYGIMLTLADMLRGRDDLTAPYWRDQAVAWAMSRSESVRMAISEEVRTALQSVWGNKEVKQGGG